MKEVTVYETSDGARFDTRKSAETHEETLKPKKMDLSKIYIEKWGSNLEIRYDRSIAGNCLLTLHPDGTFTVETGVSSKVPCVKDKLLETPF